jgi:tripartite-type tricarboxylate transporter receptor subunit TctC
VRGLEFKKAEENVSPHPYRIGIISLFLLLASAVCGAQAQTASFPDKPVTLISDAGVGSGADVAARFVADRLGKLWGQQVVVINHPGASGSIAARAASQAPADGYTLYIPAFSTFLGLPSVAPNLPVKLPRDFLPIGFAAEQPMSVAVSASLGVTTLPQLIALAKKEPGKITIALTGVGRLTHLTGELLQMRAGIKLVSIPYTRGQGSALGDVAAGRVSMIIENYAGLAGAVKAGNVKLIAVASPQRLPEFPDLPTVAETIPGFAASGWLVLVAPVGTPAPIIGKINADLNKVVSDADFKKRLAKISSYTRPMTPEQTEAFVDSQQQLWMPIVEKVSGK